MKYIIITLLLFTSLFSQTYEIVEQDVMEEALSRKDIAIENLKKEREREIEKIKNYKGSLLSIATKSKIEYIDPTYTLTQDIPKVDKQGNIVGVLYKAGFTFNPLKYITMTPPDMIIFNACIKEETIKVKELIDTTYATLKKQFMLVNSGCKSEDFADDYFRNKAYFLTDEMVNKFQLKETLSIVSVDLTRKRIKVETIKTVN